MDRFQSETYSTSKPRHFRSAEDEAEWEANHQPEQATLSACCSAEMRIEPASFETESDTGYREDERITCTACGEETEPLLQPVYTVRMPSKPVSKQQGEFFSEVA